MLQFCYRGLKIIKLPHFKEKQSIPMTSLHSTNSTPSRTLEIRQPLSQLRNRVSSKSVLFHTLLTCFSSNPSPVQDLAEPNSSVQGFTVRETQIVKETCLQIFVCSGISKTKYLRALHHKNVRCLHVRIINMS